MGVGGMQMPLGPVHNHADPPKRSTYSHAVTTNGRIHSRICMRVAVLPRLAVQIPPCNVDASVCSLRHVCTLLTSTS
jgi:hypothetical protein